MQTPLIRTLLINADRDQYVQMARLLDGIAASDYDITWCADYQYALEAMLASIHDIVLLDYDHSPETCEELLRAANAHGCTTPIICLTERINPDLDRAAIKAGAADYLVKDRLDTAVVERTIRYAIDRKRSETELARLAHYDSLTGIPNRLLFNDRLDRALQRAERGDTPFALLYLDLDGFKAINDNHGHDAGDKLVKGIARRLSQCIRRSDSVARLGGDEFTVLLERVTSTNDIVTITQKIIDVITEPFMVDGHPLRVGSSVGIAVYPEAGSDAATLLRHADRAMYQAKAVAGSGYRFFTETMNAEAVDQTRMEAALRSALNQDQFALYFQPRISLRSGKIVGAEALLRWHHPERGTVLPGEFISLAEQAGLIEPLGYWALDRLCLCAAKMDEMKLPSLRLSLNVSQRQFAAVDFVATVQAILRQHGVDGGRFEFELAESDVVANLTRIAGDMDALHAQGIHFALDDFGTGFSSLPQLQQLPIDTLKLDSSHVQKAADDEDSANIIRAMIYLAHGLELKVVAEGVESEAQKTFLAANRCDQSQGYYHSKPLPFEEFTKLLSSTDATSRRSYLSVVDK